MKKRFSIILAGVLVFASSTYALSPPTFNDEDDFASWNRDAIYHLEAEGVIMGYADGSFKPNQGVTRGETAVLLQRFETNIVDQKIEAALAQFSSQNSTQDLFSSHIDDVIDNIERFDDDDISYKTAIIMAESGLRELNSAPDIVSLELTKKENAILPQGYEAYVGPIDFLEPDVYLHYNGEDSDGDMIIQVDKWYGPF